MRWKRKRKIGKDKKMHNEIGQNALPIEFLQDRRYKPEKIWAWKRIREDWQKKMETRELILK